MPHSEELDNREVLAVHQLNIAFQEERQFIPAVQNLSFSLRRGETLAIVGESGSGKSVTAMSVAGLLPRKQGDYSGQILLDGQELLHAERSALRKIQGADIGVVFQEPQSCMDPLMKIGLQAFSDFRESSRVIEITAQ